MYQGDVRRLGRSIETTLHPEPLASLRSRPVDERPVDELLADAAKGDDPSWAALVDRFGGLVWSVAQTFNLDRASVEDVTQTVWLRLAEHCDRIQEPDRLAGWLATTTRNEALRVQRCRQRVFPQEPLIELADPTDPAVDDTLLGAETLSEVLQAFALLDEASQRLLRLLCVVPPLDYATISELTGRPVGSIGPTRQRCLQKLRLLLPPTIADVEQGGAA